VPQIFISAIRHSTRLATIWCFRSKNCNIHELQLEWIGHFYALQWLDGRNIVVAVPKTPQK
jgi:hypothetical protein